MDLDSYETAQHRIHELFSELVELIGPECFYSQAQAPSMLAEWVTVLCWVDQNGTPFISQVTSGNLLRHHVEGLLHTALYGDFAAGGDGYEEE